VPFYTKNAFFSPHKPASKEHEKSENLKEDIKRSSFNLIAKKRLCEHKVIKPTKRHKDKWLHVITKKTTNNRTQKERPKTQLQDLSCPSKISHHILK
jgi:hypothetical protein